ncbi:hypothetical protein PACTADRAFT_50149 [Pachysolen tannophilus NRRL Y-2460]|uniref:Methyltransferase type 11 domain-containing protein n=1 Tax=Pachysolen tannophilus NRRL Y-2460 TaxID=669874 RepID=A0A1E4TUM1_PACTA|nr:hypothetical protein PACTADRAFT_50149 [Pachysolen tannophilus NRRL Y-2460]
MIFKRFQSNAVQVFNRSIKLRQRQRAALDPRSSEVEYLRNLVADLTVERLSIINRNYTNFLDFGCNGGNFLKSLLLSNPKDAEVNDLVLSKLKNVYLLDSCQELLFKNNFDQASSAAGLSIEKVLVQDEESSDFLAKHQDYFDGVISNLSLHWVNDLPSVFKKINDSLKPDGMFMGSIFALDTLFELRSSFQLSELERKNGLSPHISPFVQSNDISNILNKTNFRLVTLDVDEIVVSYPRLINLMEDLKLMGENNCLSSLESISLSKDILISTEAIYKELYGKKDDKVPGGVALPATFRIIFFIGWKNSENQPKPLERGSAKVTLKDAL